MDMNEEQTAVVLWLLSTPNATRTTDDNDALADAGRYKITNFWGFCERIFNPREDADNSRSVAPVAPVVKCGHAANGVEIMEEPRI